MYIWYVAHFICCSFFVAAAPIYRRLDYMLLLLILGRTIVCTAVLPSPGLKLATAPLALANQQLSLLGRACFNQAQPGQRGSILVLNADANPLFRRGSTADRPHTSQLSLSTNCSVTAPPYRGQQLHIFGTGKQFNKFQFAFSFRKLLFDVIGLYLHIFEKIFILQPNLMIFRN